MQIFLSRVSILPPIMCELLGMNSAEPADAIFSFTGFAERGGTTSYHADGWGIAFFEDKACRMFIDHQPSATSPVAELIKRYRIKSKNIIAHIRDATQGGTTLENCHPFVRELWGRHWVFAHKGDLQNYRPTLSGTYQPVGTTDSELAFCAIMQGLRERFPHAHPPLDQIFAALTELTREITQYGVFNFLLSNGQAMFSHCSTFQHYLIRRWPFSTAHLIDVDVSIDFAKYTTPEDCMAVIATHPLTRNEVWHAFKPGDLFMFQNGELALQTNIPVPPAVFAKSQQADPARSTALLAEQL